MPYMVKIIFCREKVALSTAIKYLGYRGDGGVEIILQRGLGPRFLCCTSLAGGFSFFVPYLEENAPKDKDAWVRISRSGDNELVQPGAKLG